MEPTEQTKIAICGDILDIAKAWSEYGLNDAALELINDKINIYYNNHQYDRMQCFLIAALEKNDIPISFYITLLENTKYIKLFMGQVRIDLLNKALELSSKDKGNINCELLNRL